MATSYNTKDYMVDVAEIISSIAQNLSPNGTNIIVIVLGGDSASKKEKKEKDDDYVSAKETGEFLWPQMKGLAPSPEESFWQLADGSGNFQTADGTGKWKTGNSS